MKTIDCGFLGLFFNIFELYIRTGTSLNFRKNWDMLRRKKNPLECLEMM